MVAPNASHVPKTSTAKQTKHQRAPVISKISVFVVQTKTAQMDDVHQIEDVSNASQMPIAHQVIARSVRQVIRVQTANPKRQKAANPTVSKSVRRVSAHANQTGFGVSAKNVSDAKATRFAKTKSASKIAKMNASPAPSVVQTATPSKAVPNNPTAASPGTQALPAPKTQHAEAACKSAPSANPTNPKRVTQAQLAHRMSLLVGQGHKPARLMAMALVPAKMKSSPKQKPVMAKTTIAMAPSTKIANASRETHNHVAPQPKENASPAPKPAITRENGESVQDRSFPKPKYAMAKTTTVMDKSTNN
jgi:hypothetical protein